MTRAGLRAGSAKGRDYECSRRGEAEKGCFMLLPGKDRSQVKLRALIWEWCYYRSEGVSCWLNRESCHMQELQMLLVTRPQHAVACTTRFGFVDNAEKKKKRMKKKKNLFIFPQNIGSVAAALCLRCLLAPALACPLHREVYK